MNTIIRISLVFIGLFSILASVSGQSEMLTLTKSNLTWVGYGEVGNFQQQGFIDIANAKIAYINAEHMSGYLEFDMKSISHEDPQLQKHLKAKDFFNVKKYPKSTFSITEMKGSQLIGILNMNGHESAISFDIILNEDTEMIQVSGKAEVDRTIFDIKYNSSSYFQDLGNYAIKNVFDLNFDLTFHKS